MKSLYLTCLFFLFGANLLPVFAQSTSLHSVRYMLTSDPKTTVLTAWVVPEYATPNAYNNEEIEKGATAQFSMELPGQCRILEIQDVVGVWDKKPYRFEDSPVLRNAGISLKNKVYYVIGKTPTETNYGAFQVGKPVALFNIRLDQKVNLNQVKILDSQDDFVQEAYEKLSLNLGSSFYSRSGQMIGEGSIPLEQFVGELKEKEWMKVGKEVDLDAYISGIYAFPNPFVNETTIQYLYPGNSGKGNILISDIRGNPLLQQEVALKKGINENKFTLPRNAEGILVIKVWTEDWAKTRTLVKNK